MEKRRFHQVCPRKLKCTPNEPCPMAMESIESVRNKQPDRITCPFFIKNLDSNFCFWKYMEDECPEGGVESPKTAAQLLMISEKEYNNSLKSACTKLSDNNEDMNLFREVVAEISTNSIRDDIYSTEMWIEEVTGKSIDDIPVDFMEPGKPGRKKSKAIQPPKGFSGAGAVHKSGKRIQLYGLSDNWWETTREFQQGDTPIRMANHTLGKKDKKDDEGKDSKGTTADTPT